MRFALCALRFAFTGIDNFFDIISQQRIQDFRAAVHFFAEQRFGLINPPGHIHVLAALTGKTIGRLFLESIYIYHDQVPKDLDPAEFRTVVLETLFPEN